MSTKPPARGKLTHDHELLVISRGFDLLATLHQDRRRFVVEYWLSRLDDMPVISQVDPPREEEPPMMPHLRDAASAAA